MLAFITEVKVVPEILQHLQPTRRPPHSGRGAGLQLHSVVSLASGVVDCSLPEAPNVFLMRLCVQGYVRAGGTLHLPRRRRLQRQHLLGEDLLPLERSRFRFSSSSGFWPTVQPGQLLGASRFGRKLVITGDTRPSAATYSRARLLLTQYSTLPLATVLLVQIDCGR